MSPLNWAEHIGDHLNGRGTAEMRCQRCGKIGAGPPRGALCDCPGNVLRNVVCLACGFSFLTGGPGLAALLRSTGRPQ